jgi:hypothetical protein
MYHYVGFFAHIIDFLNHICGLTDPAVARARRRSIQTKNPGLSRLIGNTPGKRVWSRICADSFGDYKPAFRICSKCPWTKSAKPLSKRHSSRECSYTRPSSWPSRANQATSVRTGANAVVATRQRAAVWWIVNEIVSSDPAGWNASRMVIPRSGSTGLRWVPASHCTRK